jgi:hypothetical protein
VLELESRSESVVVVVSMELVELVLVMESVVEQLDPPAFHSEISL